MVSENETSIAKYGMLSKTMRELQKNMIVVQPRTPTRIYLPPAAALRVSRNAEELKVSIKIARGLHVVHTRAIVPQTYEMGVVFNEQIMYFDQVPPIYARTDTNFFRYLGYVPHDEPKAGIWYMRFYKGQTAMVWFRPKK